MVILLGSTGYIGQEFKKQLEEEYGAVNINLEDGTYTEIKEEELADV